MSTAASEYPLDFVESQLMNAPDLMIWSLYLVALFLGMAAGAMVWHRRLQQRATHRLSRWMRWREKFNPSDSESVNTPALTPSLFQHLEAEGEHNGSGLDLPAWLDTGWGRLLLPDEDRTLLDQAGIRLRTGGAVYVVSRIILAALLPLLALVFAQAHGWKLIAVAFIGLGLGLMLPKWMVRSRASRRRQQVVEELPLFIDLLRLLQGVGLSIDQSMHILVNEFGSVLPVLSVELGLANRLYATGRNREKSLQRLIQLSADEDMVAVVNLIVQVDRHGGAVQEPLKQFGLRLREKRQAAFKEKIGAITVKMTGVMVLTLLPALLVITAGPGFMAVIRSLSSVNKG